MGASHPHAVLTPIVSTDEVKARMPADQMTAIEGLYQKLAHGHSPEGAVVSCISLSFSSSLSKTFCSLTYALTCHTYHIVQLTKKDYMDHFKEQGMESGALLVLISHFKFL